jgi:hypothetical protein
MRPLRRTVWDEEASAKSYRQRGLPAHAAAQLCHSPHGGRHRPADHPGAFGPPQSADDGFVHVRLAGARGGDEEPFGLARGNEADGRGVLGVAESSRICGQPTAAGRGRRASAMNASPLELADILRAYGPAYLQAYGWRCGRGSGRCPCGRNRKGGKALGVE